MSKFDYHLIWSNITPFWLWLVMFGTWIWFYNRLWNDIIQTYRWLRTKMKKADEHDNHT